MEKGRQGSSNDTTIVEGLRQVSYILQLSFIAWRNEYKWCGQQVSTHREKMLGMNIRLRD